MTIAQAMQLAATHHAAGRLAEAEEVYRTVLAQMPSNPYALHHLGLIQLARGQRDAGIRSMRESIHADPSVAMFHLNLSSALLENGDAPGAEQAAREAVSREPENAQARINLAHSLGLQARPDEALAEARKAAELQPDNATAHSYVGMHLAGLHRFDEAVAELRKTCDLEPQNPAHYANLGGVLLEARRLPEAEAAYRKAITLSPQHAAFHADLALVLLLAGNWTEGLRENEWRLLVPELGLARPYPKSGWDGSSLAGRSIFLYSEQGYADAILLARYVPLLAESGAKVLLECRPEMARLFQSLKGVTQLVPTGKRPAEFDVHGPMMTLPLRMGATPDNVPQNVPYLSADPGSVEPARQHIESLAGNAKLRVGLVWGGRAPGGNDRQRQVLLSDLAPLAAVEGVRWFSLQADAEAEQLKQAPEGMDIVDLGHKFRDFSDMAAAMATLDLTITIDTSAAHVAGATGRPVWMMTPFLPFWPWGADSDRTPWYPSMRLFRQAAPDDWGTVLQNIAEALRQRVAEA